MSKAQSVSSEESVAQNPLSFAAFRSKGSVRLFAGQLISQTCDKMMTVGLVWVFAAFGSTDLMPWFLMVSALPHLLLAWVGGRWVSKIGEIKTLVFTDLVRGVLFLVLAVIWSQHQEPPAWIYLFVFSFLANLASALFNPAIFSVPARLADPEDLPQLTALVNSCFAVGNILGPLATIVLYPRGGLVGLFVWNGISYLLAAVIEWRIPMRALPETPAAEAGAAVTSKQGWLRRRPVVLVMLLGFLACNLFLAPLMVFLPLYTAKVFHQDLDLLAFFETSTGVGVALGSLALSFVAWHWSLRNKIRVALASAAIAFAGFAFSNHALIAAGCLGVLGFFISVINVMALTLFQTKMEPENIPQLMSYVNLIGVASLPFSMTVIGLIEPQVSVVAMARFCAVGLAVSSLVVMFHPALASLKEENG